MDVRISKKITALREQNKWSQVDLAKKTGLSQSAISYFESGSRCPNAHSLKELAIALNTTTDYLLDTQNSTLSRKEDK